MTTENKYRVFLEEAPDAFFVHDGDGRIVDVNHQACVSLGYERDELLAMTVMQLTSDFDEDSAAINWGSLQPHGRIVATAHHRRKDGTIFPVEVHASGAIVEGRKLIFGMARDISERVHAEQRQQRLTNLYRTLSEVNQTIIKLGTPADMFQRICDIAVQFGGLSAAWIGLLDEVEHVIKPAAASGDGLAELTPVTISIDPEGPYGKGLSSTAFRENRHIIVNDFQHHPLTSAWGGAAVRLDWGSCATFPLQRDGKPCAVLTVYHSTVGAFDEEMVRLLDEMALDIGFGLDNIDRERNRKKAIAKIQEQNTFLSAILDSEPECVKVISPAGELMQMNRAGLAMLEVDSLEEARAHGLLNFIALSHRDLFVDLHKRVCAGASGFLEFPIIGKKGTLRWLDSHATPLRNAAGEIEALLAVTRDVTEKKQFDERLWRQANFDPLTGLPNRNMFYDRLAQEIKKMHRSSQMLAVLFIDLDRFKEVNDTSGHQAGDALLIDAAKRIVSCVRDSDTVARLGGDEFTVILPELGSRADVEKIVGAIITNLSEPFYLALNQTHAHISASVGITIYPADGRDVDQLMRNVDQAMYEAKDRGRNCYSFFVPALREKASYKYGLLSDLRGALGANQFSLNFQPIIDLVTRRVVKLEVLVRWHHPERGAVSPAEFIPLAEESGLIVDIGGWIFREAARWINRWKGQGHNELQVGINMSPVQLQGAMKNIDAYFDALQEFNISGHNIVIEITEGLLLHADNNSRDMLRRFRDVGVELAIDDFGTGYSALSYLKKFDIDYLKIDQSFVRDLATDPSDLVLTEAIIVMAHKLGLKVIAEGVESVEQLNLLIGAGCDFAQGYLFSRPVAGEVMEKLLGSELRFD